MTNSDRIDLAIDALLNNNPVEALGHLMLYKLEPAPALREAVEKFREQTEGDLPPMQPLKSRVMPRDIKCPTCAAKPGKPCVRLTSRGPHGKPTDEPLTAPGSGKAMLHKSRSAAAKEVSQ